ncbi:phosphotransferase family protein [Halostella salina]|uniref:phosphotransferase family protein n=1 Tax=Halostella salina TaxID=1547897 RepID=UPI000EF83A48|nr:phosphotransferase family protein [Halostella salina]
MADDYYERLVDEDALRTYLESELGPADGFDVQRHREGHSNETLFLQWGDRDLVVRRPPPGETADKAHDVLREYRVVDALQDGPVPVPTTVLACDDESVIGDEFYLMERVEGDVIRDAEPERFADPDRRRRLGEELVDGLAAIHGVDYEAVGLGEFGHPEGFAERQVRRWSEQLTWAFSKTADEREVPVLYDVMEWLTDNAPEDHPHTLVHGDYKLDNVMYGPSEDPELVGVFDWEMSTLGDPLTDLGWMLSVWRDPKDPEPPASNMVTRVMEAEGYPTRRELVDRYEAKTGIEYENDRFYRALAVYKLAALGEMFFARYLQDDADDPLYPKMEETVPALGERAMRIIDGEEPL